MTRRSPFFAWTAALGAALAAAALAAPSQPIVFRDRKDNMVVRNLDSWRATRVDDRTIDFVGAGRPLDGAWRDQGLAVRAQRVEGRAVRSADGAFGLASATFAGAVRADVKGKTPEAGDVTLTCATIRWQAGAEASTARLEGDVRIVQTGPDGQTLTLSGPRATATLPALGQSAEFPLRRAEVEGPVVVTVVRRAAGRDGQPTTTNLRATAGRAVYDDAARRLELTGGVRLEGEDAVVAGEATAARAVVRLDAERKVLEVELQGEPGTATLREVRP